MPAQHVLFLPLDAANILQPRAAPRPARPAYNEHATMTDKVSLESFSHLPASYSLHVHLLSILDSRTASTCRTIAYTSRGV